MASAVNDRRGAPLTDNELLDLVQQRTLAYFWDFAHPVSGMARERNNASQHYDHQETAATGGSGFGIMALIAGVTRGFLAPVQVLERIETIVAFLGRAETYHGVFPHLMHGATGATIAFSAKDDAGDLVETSYLMAGLLSARQFFSGSTPREVALRAAIDKLWYAVEWSWHTRAREVLY